MSVPAASESSRAAEALRQGELLALLQGKAMAPDAGLAGLADAQSHGLDVYRANAAALAARALAAAFPTVEQLMGPKSFATLARAHWFAHPPARGDLGWWGEDFPTAMEQDSQLSEEAYLPDVARLDWAVHRASFAADDQAAPEGLPLLGEADPQQLHLRLRAGTAVIASAYPIVEIWRAHQQPAAAPQELPVQHSGLAAARLALLEGRAESAWVTRGGALTVQVLPLDAAGARFTQALLHSRDLEQALQQAGEAFDFEVWLIQALRQNAVSAVLDDHPVNR